MDSGGMSESDIRFINMRQKDDLYAENAKLRSELDAALAERDALRAELAARQDSFSMDRHVELMQAHENALAERDALKAAIAREFAHADRLAELFRDLVTVRAREALAAHDARRQPATEGAADAGQG